MAIAAAGVTAALAAEGIAFPKDFASFRFIGAFTVTDEKSPLAGIHLFYRNEAAKKTFAEEARNGPYPNGAAFVGKLHKLERLDSVIKVDGALVEGPLQLFTYMRKDKTARATGGWTFAAFDAERKPIAINPKTDCFDCHQ
ncbi:MAG: hypothetical protein EXQ85_09935 [Alphaproteobacteria bacterium]|nr:hypothetical protein [Alphaproteobacteria bacterium]